MLKIRNSVLRSLVALLIILALAAGTLFLLNILGYWIVIDSPWGMKPDEVGYEQWETAGFFLYAAFGFLVVYGAFIILLILGVTVVGARALGNKLFKP